MKAWCERCGWDKYSPPEVPCGMCWDGEADADLARRLVELAEVQTPDARDILGRINDPRAAPVLRGLVDHEQHLIRQAAVNSLAWINQEQDTPLAFQAAEDPEARVRRAAYEWLADVASDEAVRALAAAREQGYGAEVLRDALAWARDPIAAVRARARSHRPAFDRGVRTEPVEPRDVPRLAFKELLEAPVDPSERTPAKFGGQPDWVDEPAWPLGPGDRPMVFYGQLPVPGREGTAYIFINQDEQVLSADPLADGNAVVVQPGADPHRPTAARWKGPQLFEFVHDYKRFRVRASMRPYCRWVVMEAGADPAHWSWPPIPEGHYVVTEHGDSNKLGGTPLFLQGEEWPPGEGWRFGFQFAADWAGEELGDGAECYGFFNDDGRGAFLWQCH